MSESIFVRTSVELYNDKHKLLMRVYVQGKTAYIETLHDRITLTDTTRQALIKAMTLSSDVKEAEDSDWPPLPIARFEVRQAEPVEKQE